MRASKTAAAVAIFAMILALRVHAAFTLPINSDEPQHLHVVWAWTQGLLPYRDVFDNHAPLFQLLSAPLLAGLGERADIVPLMRLAMIPLYFGALWLVWYIGNVVWSRRVGWLAALLVAPAPIFFQVSAQFRPDNLWMLLWLAAAAAAVSPRPGRYKAAIVGVLIGAAFAVSLKSVLPATTGLAAAVIVGAVGGRPFPNATRTAARQLLRGLAGALVIPAAFAVYLVGMHAWRPAIYCLLSHNIVPDLGHWRGAGLRFLLVAIGWPACIAAVRYFRPTDEEAGRWRARAWLLLSTALYTLALYGTWPLVTHQDLLPVIPLLGVGVAATIGPAVFNGSASFLRVAIALAVAFIDTTNAIAASTMKPDMLRNDEAELERILRLTRAGDYVMDAKGQAIFRQRPVYWVLEGITEQRIQDGSIHDDIAERLVATGTPAVIMDRLPPADAKFVSDNYFCTGGGLHIAGRRLPPPQPRRALSFQVVVPSSYAIIDPDGAVPGQLDGKTIAGARFLTAGTHVLETSSTAPLALVWAPSLSRGLTPAFFFEHAGHPCPASRWKLQGIDVR